MVVIVMITIILMDTADSATSVTPLQPWLSLSCGRSLKTSQMSHHHMDLFHFITETQLVQLHVTASRLLSYMLKLSCQWAVELLKQTHTRNLPLRTDCKSCVASLESCLVNTWRIFCKHEALRPTQRLSRNRKTCGCARFVNKTAPSGWSFTLPLMSLFYVSETLETLALVKLYCICILLFSNKQKNAASTRMEQATQFSFKSHPV